MKYAVHSIGILLVLTVVYLTTAFFVPAVRFAPVYAPVYALTIHFRLVEVKEADWGYLKLRSGEYGLMALGWLERNSAPDIAQTSVAVQEQWRAAGHPFDVNPWLEQENETRFGELTLRHDAKTLSQNLEPQQSIPETFWRDQRFRAGCFIVPRSATREDTCTLRMADLTGDSTPEIIVEGTTTGTLNFYSKPIVRSVWEVYGQTNGKWTVLNIYAPCDVERPTSDVRMTISNQKLDMVWVDGHAVNFFSGDCHSARTSLLFPAFETKRAAIFAPRIVGVLTLPGSKPVPASLAAALADQAVVTPTTGRPVVQADVTYGFKPRQQRLPDCFISNAPADCAAFVTDLDRDGFDDVIVLGEKIFEGKPAYRFATLLMQKQGIWQVFSNRAICAKPATSLSDVKLELKPSTWRPVDFAGKLILPEEETDICAEAHLPGIL